MNILQNNKNTTELLNFLKKQTIQYKPLSKSEEKQLIEKYKNDRITLNKLLFMHNIRAVFNIAKKYMLKTNDFDAMVQDGMLGLAEAANRFDITKDIKFITYATIWIRKYILARFYGKQVELDKKTTSLNSQQICQNIKANNGNEVTLENFVNEFIDPTYNIKSIEQELSSNEQSKICKALLEQLNSDTSLSTADKQIFVDIFYNKQKTTDIALKHGINRQNVIDIKNKILDKFKTILKNKYSINSYYDI